MEYAKQLHGRPSGKPQRVRLPDVHHPQGEHLFNRPTKHHEPQRHTGNFDHNRNIGLVPDDWRGNIPQRIPQGTTLSVSGGNDHA